MGASALQSSMFCMIVQWENDYIFIFYIFPANHSAHSLREENFCKILLIPIRDIVNASSISTLPKLPCSEYKLLIQLFGFKLISILLIII